MDVVGVTFQSLFLVTARQVPHVNFAVSTTSNERIIFVIDDQAVGFDTVKRRRDVRFETPFWFWILAVGNMK